jgi:two-component system phosphate regulon sensor histidine kinase PhoR
LKLGIRGRLFLVSVAVVLAVIAASGLYLRPALRGQLEARIEAELTRHARSARELILAAPAATTLEVVDRMADRMGAATSARVTIINGDGIVLGDSDLSATQLRAVENHGGRPEVRRALREGKGITRRHSTTLGTDMLYLGLPYRRPDGSGVVRVAMPLDEVDRAVHRLHLLLGIATLLALGIAVLMSGLAAHAVGLTLRRVVGRARQITERSTGSAPAPARDELGGLLGSVSRMADELEQQMTHLAAERDRFAAVLEGMAEGVLALDRERRITHVNRAALQLLGLTEPPVGRTLLEVVRAPALHELVTGTRLQAAEKEIDLPGEKQRRVLARAAPLRATGGVALVLHDLTELRRLETVRQDFVANVSHELRTPASIILASSETLLGGALADPQRGPEFLEALRRNAQRLSNLVSDLLEISRLDSGSAHLEPRPLPLAESARGCVETLRSAAQQKQLTVDLAQLDPTLQVLADEGALQQVIFNLVDNAVKYTPAGGKIALRARLQGERVRLEVQDDGPGIEPRHRERIFERFYRVDSGRSRQMGGTGLGLSIVKNLVEAMGGEVGVEHASPRGSVFWVLLPAR